MSKIALVPEELMVSQRVLFRALKCRGQSGLYRRANSSVVESTVEGNFTYDPSDVFGYL